MDLNSVVSIVLFGSIVLMFVVRMRSKRSDRKRDKREAKARAARRDDGPSLY